MSGTRTRNEVIPASGELRVGSGNFFFLTAAGAAVDVTFVRDGTQFGCEDAMPGYVKGVIREWDKAYIRGTAGTSVTWIEGYESIAEDFTDFRRTVGAFTQVLPQTVADAADVDVGGSAVAVIVAAANAARRRVTVKVRDDATVKVRIGSISVTATRGVQLGAGESQTFEGPYAVYAIREAAGTAFAAINEEVM